MLNICHPCLLVRGSSERRATRKGSGQTMTVRSCRAQAVDAQKFAELVGCFVTFAWIPQSFIYGQRGCVCIGRTALLCLFCREKERCWVSKVLAAMKSAKQVALVDRRARYVPNLRWRKQGLGRYGCGAVPSLYITQT